jgi:hypothetical protein
METTKAVLNITPTGEVETSGKPDWMRYLEERDFDKAFWKAFEKAFEKVYGMKPSSHEKEDARQIVAEKFVKKGMDYIIDALAKTIGRETFYALKKVFEQEKSERLRLEQNGKDYTPKPKDPHEVAEANEFVTKVTAEFPKYVEYVQDVKKKKKENNRCGTPVPTALRTSMCTQKKGLVKLLRKLDPKEVEYVQKNKNKKSKKTNKKNKGPTKIE